MTRSVSKLLLDTAELRAGGVLTEREINALKKRWRPRPGGLVSRGEPYAECEWFMKHGPYRVCREQADKGLTYLRGLVFRKDGEPRQTKWMRENMIPERIGVLQNFSHFELIDWQWDGTSAGWMWPQPVYRVFDTTGNFFDYICRPWQAGHSEVIE